MLKTSNLMRLMGVTIGLIHSHWQNQVTNKRKLVRLIPESDGNIKGLREALRKIEESLEYFWDGKKCLSIILL